MLHVVCRVVDVKDLVSIELVGNNPYQSDVFIGHLVVIMKAGISGQATKQMVLELKCKVLCDAQSWQRSEYKCMSIPDSLVCVGCRTRNH